MAVPSTLLQSKYAAQALSCALAEAGLMHGGRSGADSVRVTWQETDTSRLVTLLASFVMQEWLQAVVDERLLALYPFLDRDEREYIGLLVLHALRRDMVDPVQTQLSTDTNADVAQAISSALANLDEQGSTLQLDAVVRFRLRSFYQRIGGTVMAMVDQFLNDREYEEFVAMLRYMLDAQPMVDVMLNVFCTDERVWICDSAGELVRDTEVTAAAWQASDGEKLDGEDLTMSILITRAPARIRIHDLCTAAPWPSFAETVERVFLHRATRCADCPICRSVRQQREAIVDGPLSLLDNRNGGSI